MWYKYQVWNIQCLYVRVNKQKIVIRSIGIGVKNSIRSVNKFPFIFVLTSADAQLPAHHRYHSDHWVSYTPPLLKETEQRDKKKGN